MKFILLFASVLLGAFQIGHATVIEFDLSPPGIDAAVGLHPLNEVISGLSNGNGNEIGHGIFFDTSSRLLTLNLAYGSAYGFADLTGPAFSWLLHGPSGVGETAPALFNLQTFHTFAIDGTRGGQIAGAVTLSAEQGASLLAGLNYINIYTPQNLGGELRGQLVVVPEPNAMLLLGLNASALLWRSLSKRRRATR